MPLSNLALIAFFQSPHDAGLVTTLPILPKTGTLASGARSQQYELAALENYVTNLTTLGHPIPPSILHRLNDLKSKEIKRTAKRAANRRSASTSRARKNALVEEITERNRRLKRQAVILNFLPDMIFAVNGGTGRITFCSGKVTKILLHSEESLLASSFYSLMLPHSVPIIKRLISNTLRTNEKEGKGIRGAKEARDVSDMSSSSIARSNSPSSNDSSNALHNDALNNSSLNRNVLAHKSAMNDKQGAKGNGDDLKDDVNGEKVTRNNANARLSSLRFREKEGRGKKRDREGKSRGREEETRELSSEVGSSEGNLADEEDGSFPSREDSGESFTGEINGATSGEQKILSSCKVCLIRKDMSTVWCEATFNARLLEKEVVGQEGAAADDNNNGQRKKGERKNVKKEDGGEEPVVEYLFSLRPIRDGELAPEELRLTVKEDECSHSSSDRTNPVTTTSTSNSTSASNPPSPTPNSPVTGSVNSPARRRDRLKSVKGLVKAVGGTEEKELSVIEGLLTLTGRK